MAWPRRRNDYGRLLPTHRWQGISRGRRFWRALRPWLGAAVLIAGTWYWFGTQRIGPSVIPPGPHDVISGPFTLCGAGRAANCVVDGDTIMLSQRKIRIMGIDAPEIHPPRCAEEARLGAAATQELLRLLNQGPMTVAGTDPPARDEYGRELRHLLRRRGDGSVQSLADDMVASGAARAYLRGSRVPWC